jgi:glycerate kinase
MRIVAAPDKFRGSATAAEVAASIAEAAQSRGHDCEEIPVADGGEGTLLALGGTNRSSVVGGPLGDPVDAPWRFDGHTAVIEMAAASGLELIGGPHGNEPVDATTVGTGELIAAAAEAGARRIIVALGGSATTDGGLGALRAMGALARYRGIELIAAVDVETPFVDAASQFGPQKGASGAQVRLLTRRLERLSDVYREDYGVDVSALIGAGAAGGLGGGLVAAGARIVAGFELVADELDLYERIVGADLVVAGEGRVDATSFKGKALGGVCSLAAAASVSCGAVVGQVDAGVEMSVPYRSLIVDHGADRAFGDTLGAIRDSTIELLKSFE